MFNIIRPISGPGCTTSYTTQEIIKTLTEIFHDKCYLCEQNNLSDPEVEHFIPHEGDNNKKFDWNNLFLSCSRCNSIKSNTHKNLLDCSDANINVAKVIKHFMPSAPDLPVQIVPAAIDDEKSINTAKLLNDCFNLQNTPFRSITREVLIEKMFTHYNDFIQWRQQAVDIRSTPSEAAIAIEKLTLMQETKYPFSIFWRWHIAADKPLLKIFPHLPFLKE